MSANYYLQNGIDGVSNTVNLLVNGKLQRDFIDIAHLDLETMKIENSKKIEILSEYNQGIDLTGNFFNASYPHKDNKTKTYLTIFGRTNPKTKYYIDKLREIAEKRKFLKDTSDKVTIEIDKEIDAFIRLVLHNIMKDCPYEAVTYNSMIASRIKELIREKTNEKPHVGIDNFIDSHSEVIRNVLGNYTQLRIATLSYILYLEKQSLNKRQSLNDCKKWTHNNMFPIPSFEYVEEEIEQLSFFDDGKTKGLRK